MIDNYETNSHSVFLLQYHLILVTKYRRQVLTKPITNRLKKIFEYISIKYYTFANFTLSVNHTLKGAVLRQSYRC